MELVELDGRLLARVLASNGVAKRRAHFVPDEIDRNGRNEDDDDHEQHGEPELRVRVDLELHAVVVLLRYDVEDELGVEHEVEDEIERDASPHEEVVDPGPVLDHEANLRHNHHGGVNRRGEELPWSQRFPK